MRRLWSFAPLIALALIVAFGATVLLSGRERRTISDGLVGQPLPAYALPALAGDQPITPALFAGRPYVINVFASWCAPCRVEHPLLQQLAAAGAPILGVAYKDEPEATQRFLRDLGDPFAAVAQDSDGRYGLEIGVAGVPETFVIGADGAILALHRGPLDEAALRDTILPALRGET
ncbi:MAG: DsbE family thiol:disulfide interchange protein [Hyphomonadaceae bacterium]|nr:DsbE family thiol:disulfide interchange protein [Hyphomonadaceae bacterium]